MWPFSRLRPRASKRADAGEGPSISGDLGRAGEELARKCLRKIGMKILAVNYRCPQGESDLIALDASTRKTHGAETIVFVEVKTRTSDRYTDPESAVNADKRRRMKRIVDYYLSTHRAEGFNIRFDIVSIVHRPGEKPHIKHIPAAFE